MILDKSLHFPNLSFFIYKMGLCHSYATNTEVMYEAVIQFLGSRWTQMDLDSGDRALTLAFLFSATMTKPTPTPHNAQIS